MEQRLTKLGYALSDLLLPYDYRCIHCGEHRHMREGRCFCHDCREALRALEIGALCPRCMLPRASCACAGVDCYAAYRYDNIVRALIGAYKYHHTMGVAFALARQCEALIRVAASGMDMFVPVPLHARKQTERGFNQAEVLARKYRRYAGIPVYSLLRRIRDTPTQTNLTRQERIENVRGAFAVAPPVSLHGKGLVLVDDVLTTGATTEECARMLFDAGAREVRVLTVAAAVLAGE